MNSLKSINFRQTKYTLPAILYPLFLFLGYHVIDLFFNTSATEVRKDNGLQTTDYLNSELPSANVSSDIGSKRKNVRDLYGNIVDKTAVDVIGSDRDSLNRKEEYTSKLTDEELDSIRRQEEARNEIDDLRRQLKEAQDRAAQLEKERVAKTSRGSRSTDLVGNRQELLDELDRELGNMLTRSGVRGGRGSSDSAAVAGVQGPSGMPSGGDDTPVVAGSGGRGRHDGGNETAPRGDSVVRAPSADAAVKVVAKEVTGESSYFSTISANQSHPQMIKAIIDEDVKAVDGSRVRLRLLDNIIIEDVRIPKGTYLYAIMSGFGSKRVKGTVESVMSGDRILPIRLSLYDTDGLEGLYVPESNFRETVKDIGSNALNGGSSQLFGSTGTGSAVSQMATQAVVQAYQRTTQAISKAIRKNKVRLKYGTHVYLLNGRSQDRRGSPSASDGIHPSGSRSGGGVSRIGSFDR